MSSRAWPLVSLSALLVTGCSSSETPATTSAKSAAEGTSAAAPIKADGVDESSICQAALTDAQQQAAGIEDTEPDSAKGEVSCYFLMTSDEDNPAGYVVSLFKNETALLQVADATDASPTKAVPVILKGRNAARQVMYGDTWRSSLTVDIGAGQFLYVERYSPAHVVAEKDLNNQARKVAGQVLGNLEKRRA
ncbi:hypothetical protein ACFWZ2_21450 [Streptomyces sp. NPDC059002]|uniref:hypothetical protein n=1 Tax=Streptomyces sp. NPDC059002 TaxID=3346690 RepID=UPI0036B19E7E